MGQDLRRIEGDMFTMDDTPSEPSYVFGDTEVVKTGRKAAKTLSSGKQDIQYEITPKHHINGNWKKWVRDNDLYLVEDN